MKSHGLGGQQPSGAVVSEWEDNVAFDSDDPDFSGGDMSGAATGGIVFRTPTAVLSRSTTCFSIGATTTHVPASLPRFLKGEYTSKRLILTNSFAGAQFGG